METYNLLDSIPNHQLFFPQNTAFSKFKWMALFGCTFLRLKIIELSIPYLMDNNINNASATYRICPEWCRTYFFVMVEYEWGGAPHSHFSSYFCVIRYYASNIKTTNVQLAHAEWMGKHGLSTCCTGLMLHHCWENITGSKGIQPGIYSEIY